MSAPTRPWLACLVLLLASSSFAQYYPQPVYPGYGPGGVLQGRAEVINATGNLYSQAEQARIQREAAEQAKLVTKKSAFDLRLYEQSLTPAYGERQARNKALFLKRIMTQPQEAEITNGTALNTMLPYLTSVVTGGGVLGPPVKLDPEQLKQINVTIAASGQSLGVLKDGGAMDWPLAVRGPTQKKLAEAIPRAMSAVASDSLDLKTYNEVAKGVAKLQDELRTKFRAEEIDGGLYLDGKRFLDNLENGVKAMRQPYASKLLSGAYAATGNSVPELAINMSQKGLKFAPATPGNEAPYFGLYSQMVVYAGGATDSKAFRNQTAATNVYQQYYEKSKRSQ